MKAPSDITVQEEWFKTDFVTGGKCDHITLFPHKTDACNQCQTIRIDLDSLEASLRKHKLHKEDAWSIGCQATMKDIEHEMQAL